MNKFYKAVLLGVVLLFFSCNKNEKINTLKIGKITEIELEKTVENSDYGLSLRVDHIEDTRCPLGVCCFWQGNASVDFQLTTQNEKYNFKLDTYPNAPFKNDTVIEGKKYQLKDVLPYPGSGENSHKRVVKILVDHNN